MSGPISSIGSEGVDSTFTDRLLAVLRKFRSGADRLDDVVRLSGGASQETWSLCAVTASDAERLILRRSSSEQAVVDKIGIETEAALMRAASSVGVPSPVVHYVLTLEDGLGRGFLMSHVHGETLGRRIVRDPAFAAVRPELARQAGAILARIHGIDINSLPSLPRIPPSHHIDALFDTYRRHSALRPVFELAFRWLRDHIPADTTPRLVHSDFRTGNLIVDQHGIAAVLDWELAHIGDPGRDLGWLCTNSWRFGAIDAPVGGFGVYDDLIAGYESAGGQQVSREALRFWEAFGSLCWGVMCVGMGARAAQSDRPIEMSMIARRASETEIDLLRLLAPRGA